VSLASDPNEEFRAYMEDGHMVVEPLLQGGGRRGEQVRWGFFAVYDGHGGRQEVDYCEKKLHDVVLAELRAMGPSPSCQEGVKAALASAFKKVDRQLEMLGAWSSGCTATVALVRRQGAGATLFVANVGDSRAVLLGGRRGVQRVSRDHRASDPAEAQRVVEEGGLVRHGRVGGQLSVSRSLGDHHLKTCGVSCIPDVFACELGSEHHGTALLIASDGLWDALTDADAREVFAGCVSSAVSQGGSPQAVGRVLRDTAARTLVEIAKDRGSKDNILALVIFL